jgi:hypothetical protein
MCGEDGCIDRNELEACEPCEKTQTKSGEKSPKSTAELVTETTESKGSDFPSTPTEVTTGFLSGVFGTEVLAFEVDASKVEEGVLGDAFRIYSITYKGSNTGKPTSCYLKVAKSMPEFVELSVSSGAYAKEVYRISYAKEVSSSGAFTSNRNRSMPHKCND